MDVKSENLELYVQDINISLELEELDLEDIPMIILKSSLKVQVKDWSDQFQLNGMLNIFLSHFKILNCIKILYLYNIYFNFRWTTFKSFILQL